jgi:hypothetical protein
MGAPATAAQTHAILRARSGFDINQLASEYRALRASVLRLWTEAYQPGDINLEDVIRFNEAIDQALAESVQSCPGAWGRDPRAFRQCSNGVRCAPASPQSGLIALSSNSRSRRMQGTKSLLELGYSFPIPNPVTSFATTCETMSSAAHSGSACLSIVTLIGSMRYA